MKDLLYGKTFNREAILYNEIRPQYPRELFSTLIQATHMPTKAQLLEIGPGTGQATKSLAEHGYTITAIELGQDLATIAKQELRSYKNVEVIHSSFEDIVLQPQTYDLVYAATAFHWIDENIKFTKSHSLLKHGGYLAIIRTCHILTEDTRSLFDAMQPIYDSYKDISTKAARAKVEKPIDILPDVLDHSLYQQVFFGVFPMRITYSTNHYLKLLNTFSETISMKTDQRMEFLKEIEILINEHGGKVVMDYGIPLTIGQKI